MAFGTRYAPWCFLSTSLPIDCRQPAGASTAPRTWSKTPRRVAQCHRDQARRLAGREAVVGKPAGRRDRPGPRTSVAVEEVGDHPVKPTGILFIDEVSTRQDGEKCSRNGGRQLLGEGGGGADVVGAPQHHGRDIDRSQTVELLVGEDPVDT